MGLKFWKIEGFNTMLIDVFGRSQEMIVCGILSQAKSHPLELLAPLTHWSDLSNEVYNIQKLQVVLNLQAVIV